MQWLIDMVIEMIGIPPVFIDRGDPVAVDFAVGDFWADNTWRDLDLSAIVPEHAQAVLLKVSIQDNLINKRIRLRTDGNANAANSSELRTQIANVRIAGDLVVPLPESRIIEYRAEAVVWTFIDLTVKGWWF